jgi:hypothetical protein
MNDHDTAAITTSALPRASRWEDYVDVFIAPAELFRRRAHDRVSPPLITLLALGAAFYFLLLPANTIMMQATAARNPEAAGTLEQWSGMLQLIGGVTVPITYLVMIGFAAVVLWFAGRIADVRTETSRTMLIATYAGFVLLLGQIAGAVAVILHGADGLDIARHMSFGPARFLTDTQTSPVIVALWRRLELFTVWQAALWAVGIAVIYRTTRGQAALVAGLAWLIMTVPTVLVALLQLYGTR